jgi:heme/copper-type cytochrome/quinol oxidase subunit 3
MMETPDHRLFRPILLDVYDARAVRERFGASHPVVLGEDSAPEEASMLEQTLARVPEGRRFYLGVAIAAAVVVFAGFAPTYYLKSFTATAQYPTGATVSSSLPLLIHIHAIVATTWLVLLLVQTTLVAAGRTDLHRRLGVTAAVIAPLLVVLGVMTAIRGARDGWNPGGPFSDSLAFLAVGFTDILLFSSFVAAGFYYRRRSEVHKRLMVLGTLGGLMWPAITRIPFVAPRPLPMFGLLAGLVIAAPVRDYFVQRRVHPVSLWGGLAILASFPIRQVIAATDAWHQFAAWVIR